MDRSDRTIFGMLTDDQMRRRSHPSTRELEAAIGA
jgi:hypothetical protein